MCNELIKQSVNYISYYEYHQYCLKTNKKQNPSIFNLNLDSVLFLAILLDST